MTLPIAGVLLYGMYLTRSRGAIVGLIVIVGLAIYRKYRLLGAGAASVVAFLLLVTVNFAAGRSLTGGSDRIMLWSDGFGLLKSSPLWGVGFRGFVSEVGMTAHNSFLLAAVELGIVGYTIWIAVLFLTFWELQIVANRPAANDTDILLSKWASAMSLSLTAFLVTGFFLSRTYAPQLYMLLGMSAAVCTVEAERHRRSDNVPAGAHWVGRSVATAVGLLALMYVMVRLGVL